MKKRDKIIITKYLRWLADTGTRVYEERTEVSYARTALGLSKDLGTSNSRNSIRAGAVFYSHIEQLESTFRIHRTHRPSLSITGHHKHRFV